ncbi:MAG: radical SAM protein [Nitrospinota bacterium]|nr:radical SAM protein [Nitrospinota bacterium]
MEKQGLDYLLNIGLLLTYKCQIACPHCIIKAGPNRKEKIPVEVAFDWISQVSRYREGHVNILSITGGEPFFDIDYLKDISDFAAQCGLIPTVVSNAFWAGSRASAKKVMANLQSVKMFTFSTDVYHQKAIPIENILNAILAAKELGRPHSVAVCAADLEEPEYKKTIDTLLKVTEKRRISSAITFPVGRAAMTLGAGGRALASAPCPAACLSGDSPIIFPDGRVTACIGPVIDIDGDHPLLLGRIGEMSIEEILDKSETNAALHAIRVWGPKKIISELERRGVGNLLPKEYFENSVCDACYRLMSDDKIVSEIEKLAMDEQFMLEVAYGRLYHLGEGGSGIDGEAQPLP